MSDNRYERAVEFLGSRSDSWVRPLMQGLEAYMQGRFEHAEQYLGRLGRVGLAVGFFDGPELRAWRELCQAIGTSYYTEDVVQVLSDAKHAIEDLRRKNETLEKVREAVKESGEAQAG